MIDTIGKAVSGAISNVISKMQQPNSIPDDDDDDDVLPSKRPR